MSQTIKIKRTTGTGKDTAVDQGELFYAYGTGGTYGKRLAIGHVNGGGNTPEIIGGAFFTDMLDHTAGTLTASSAIIADSNSKISALNVGSGLNNYSSANVQFNTIEPRINVITPGSGTFIRSSMRTISATSAGGNEVSFQDNGFEPVTLNQLNILPTTRMLASRVNENEYLPNFPDNKSFTLSIDLKSDDPNLSPAINIENEVILLGRSRLNRPISDYVTDGRSNSMSDDPHTATYITKKVDLQNPASSLKVIVGAYRHTSADFRVLYQLYRNDSEDIEQAFVPFPGYDNLRDTDGDGFGDRIIDATKNNGRPDARVVANAENEFSEYQFSTDDLEPFTGFRIKIVMSGTNEAFAPRFKDFRVIALA